MSRTFTPLVKASPKQTLTSLRADVQALADRVALIREQVAYLDASTMRTRNDVETLQSFMRRALALLDTRTVWGRLSWLVRGR